MSGLWNFRKDSNNKERQVRRGDKAMIKQITYHCTRCGSWFQKNFAHCPVCDNKPEIKQQKLTADNLHDSKPDNKKVEKIINEISNISKEQKTFYFTPKKLKRQKK
jgi:predicted ATP-dependent serine protease